MKTNMNAGIIKYRESKMPGVLSMLTQPKVESSIVISGENQEIGIYIFDCPVNSDKVDKKRYKLLNDLIGKNNVKFLVERFEAQVKSNVSPQKKELHYTELLKEIKATKQLAALIRLSQMREENLLAGRIGFIMGDIDRYKIDLLSEEAASVMVYECPQMTEQQKKKLHADFMEKKGVSIIFTKDISSIIAGSDVISIDEEVVIDGYADMLSGKVLVGKSKSDAVQSIHHIILWTEEINPLDKDQIPVLYNDEILAIIRYNNSKLDIIEFIKKLPYIYF